MIRPFARLSASIDRRVRESIHHSIAVELSKRDMAEVRAQLWESRSPYKTFELTCPDGHRLVFDTRDFTQIPPSSADSHSPTTGDAEPVPDAGSVPPPERSTPPAAAREAPGICGAPYPFRTASFTCVGPAGHKGFHISPRGRRWPWS